MNYRKLANILTTSLFCIEPITAQKYLELINSDHFLGNKEIFTAQSEMYLNFSRQLAEYENGNPNDYHILCIPVSGPLMKEDGWCGEMGMESMASKIMEAKMNPFCVGMILEIDSPGGMVYGTERLASVIKDFGKPSVSVVKSGMCASAAYWVASATDRIFSDSETNTIGSIGVMISIVSKKARMEKEGIKVMDIVSDLSPDKNKMYFEAVDGSFDSIKNESLNPLAEIFINTVKENRKNVSNETLTGKTFTAKKAIELGLIDEIGDIEKAIKYILNS